ncbi:hypothetical protein KXS07_31510 [Inquilinus limosus]|uniref:hypothetical protein n=1 Tax=Inquilinus limosus TaxID=171674 RepID=UPI003F1827ED
MIAKIVNIGAPVLCADTCTVLDLMRDPTRESLRLHERQAALALLAAIESGADLVALIADQVAFEFDENAGVVECEAATALQKLKAQIRKRPVWRGILVSDRGAM